MQKPVNLVDGDGSGSSRRCRLSALPWFAVTRKDAVALVNICGEIGIHGEPVESLIEQIGDAKKIQLVIDSRGGCTLVTLKLLAALAGRHVEANITGSCYSAATLLALSAARIRIEARARIMVHSPRIWLLGDENDFELAAARIREIKTRWRELLRARAPQSAALVDGWLDDGQDHYFTAVEAKAIGLADEVFTVPTPAPAPAAAVPDTLPPRNQTDDEILLLDFLRTFGRIEVSDREKFFRNLSAWFAGNVA